MTAKTFDTSTLAKLPEGFSWQVTGERYENNEMPPDVTLSLLDPNGGEISQEWIDMGDLARDPNVSTVVILRHAIADASDRLVAEAGDWLKREEEAAEESRRHKADVAAWNSAHKELGL